MLDSELLFSLSTFPLWYRVGGGLLRQCANEIGATLAFG